MFKLLGTTLKYQDNFEFKFLDASGYWIVNSKDRVTYIVDTGKKNGLCQGAGII